QVGQRHAGPHYRDRRGWRRPARVRSPARRANRPCTSAHMGDHPSQRAGRVPRPRGDRRVHAAAHETRLGDHHPQVPGPDLDRVVVDLTGGTFANGRLYVALSRCTSLQGLVLKRDVLPRDLKTDVRVRRYLATGTAAAGTSGEAYLSVLTVGTSGDRWRPRPVEIAVVTEDGDEATTVVNPTSDLYSASSEFGITARDVQLAPLLAESWPALSSLLAGRVPVGVHM